LSVFEQDYRKPTLKQAELIAKALNCEVNILFGNLEQINMAGAGNGEKMLPPQVQHQP